MLSVNSMHMISEVINLKVPIYQEKIPVQIFETIEEASEKVAREIAALIIKKQLEGKNAVIGFATGNTPKIVYSCLVRMHKQEGLSFKNVVAFNLDEY